MICSSVNRFFTSNLLRSQDWTPNISATQNRGNVVSGSNKVVSLCGSRNKETNEITWLQYRFGRIDHPELIYPTTTHGSLSKFFGNRVSGGEGSYLQYDIWFHIGAYNYSVSAYEADDETNKEFHVYVYQNKRSPSASGKRYLEQGSLNCAKSSEQLMGRLGDLLPMLRPEPEIEN